MSTPSSLVRPQQTKSRLELLQERIKWEEKEASQQRPQSRLQELQDRIKAEEAASVGGGEISAEERADSWRKPAVLAKEGFAEATGGLVDLAALPWNLAAPVVEFLEKKKAESVTERSSSEKIGNQIFGELSEEEKRQRSEVMGRPVPRIPSAVEGISHGIDRSTDGYTTTRPEDRIAAAAVRGAVGIAAPGGLAKLAVKQGAKGAGKALSWLGSTNPAAAAGGAVASAELEAAHLHGDNSLKASGKAIGAGLVVDAALSPLFAGKAALKRGYNTLDRTVKRATGFGPDNLNLEAYDAAKAAGITPRNAAISNSQDVATAEKVLGNLPFIGKTIKGTAADNDKTATRFIENTLDSVGPRKTEEIMAQKNSLYAKADSLIDPEEMLTSDLLGQAVKEAKFMLPRKSVKGDSVKKAAEVIRDIEKDFLAQNPSGKITINGSQVDLKSLSPEARESLLRAMGEQNKTLNMRDSKDLKEQLGEIITKVETMIGATPSRDSGPGKGLAALIKIRESVGETMKTSQKKDYLAALKEADVFYASMKRRETLDRILGGISGMEIAQGVNSVLDYNQILKRSTRPENKEALKKAFGDTYYKKFENFLKYADSVSSLSDPRRRNANPSASGIITLASKLLMSGRFTLASTLYLPCLTSEKFLENAVRYARNPTEKTASSLVAVTRDVTGFTAYQLKRMLAEQEVSSQKTQKDEAGQ